MFGRCVFARSWFRILVELIHFFRAYVEDIFWCLSWQSLSHIKESKRFFLPKIVIFTIFCIVQPVYSDTTFSPCKKAAKSSKIIL